MDFFVLLKSDGYSMKDIRYTWSKGKESIDLSDDLTLPQFKIMGHKQEARVISLSTGQTPF